MKSLVTVTNKGTRLEQLETLAKILAKSIQDCDDNKSLAQLARQYRETTREIDEIKGVSATDDEIGEILSIREADGKPGAVRKARA